MTEEHPHRPPPLVTISPGDLYSRELREGAVEAFGVDGAWLALSILHYSWRAHYDLASCIATERRWSDVDPLGGRATEYQIVRDLLVQALMYAAAEQLATLVDSAHAYAEGADFFNRYVEGRLLRHRIDTVSALDRDDLHRIMGVPADVDQFAASLQARGYVSGRREGAVDLADPPTTNVGGVLIPTAAFDRALVTHIFAQIANMVEALQRNLHELRQLVERPVPAVDLGVQPQSLREVDNAFRHGLRLLFHTAIPLQRHFQALHLGEGTGTHNVDIYLPRPGESVKFAMVSCSPERSESHIDIIRRLCLRTGQVIRGLLGGAVFGDGVLLMSAAGMSLDGKDDAET